MGIMLRMKLMSLWKRVRRNGLYWIRLSNKRFYNERIRLYGKKLRFSNLFSPEMVFIIDPGRYDVKIYTVMKRHCINWSVYWIRYNLAVNIATNIIMKTTQTIEWKNSSNPASTRCVWLSNKSGNECWFSIMLLVLV